MEYPMPKQVNPKLITAIKSTIPIGSTSFPPVLQLYVFGGRQSLRRKITAYRYGIPFCGKIST
jgi:hypothetical protein